jgi:hypothetical protein
MTPSRFVVPEMEERATEMQGGVCRGSDGEREGKNNNGKALPH